MRSIALRLADKIRSMAETAPRSHREPHLRAAARELGTIYPLFDPVDFAVTRIQGNADAFEAYEQAVGLFCRERHPQDALLSYLDIRHIDAADRLHRLAELPMLRESTQGIHNGADAMARVNSIAREPMSAFIETPDELRQMIHKIAPKLGVLRRMNIHCEDRADFEAILERPNLLDTLEDRSKAAGRILAWARAWTGTEGMALPSLPQRRASQALPEIEEGRDMGHLLDRLDRGELDRNDVDAMIRAYQPELGDILGASCLAELEAAPGAGKPDASHGTGLPAAQDPFARPQTPQPEFSGPE